MVIKTEAISVVGFVKFIKVKSLDCISFTDWTPIKEATDLPAKLNCKISTGLKIFKFL